MNDALQQMERGKPDPEGYEAGYRELLDWTLRDTKARIIMLESFLLPAKPEWVKLRTDYLNPILAVQRKLAKEYKLPFLPLDEIFAAAAKRQKISYWSVDGIHPIPSGHALIEQTYLKLVGA
jgi:hypothetical protein